jgi:hypothetical protein
MDSFSSSIPGRTAPIGRQPNLPGDVYNRLTLISEVPNQEHKSPALRKWYVKCSCVNQTEKEIRLAHIRNGDIGSCGCIQKEVASEHFKNINTTHNNAYHPLYPIWHTMIARCSNPNNSRFAGWGGKGISVCDRWQSIENFIEDMWPSYKPGLTIDRIDNLRNYTPDNCRWATITEQNRNRQNNILVSYKGKNICFAEAAEIVGMEYKTAYQQLRGFNWSMQKIFGNDFNEPT